MLESAGPNPNLEQILIAFLAPVLESGLERRLRADGADSGDSRHVCRPSLQDASGVASSNDSADAIGKALPELSRTEIMWRLHFTGGAMAHVLARSHLLPELMPGYP